MNPESQKLIQLVEVFNNLFLESENTQLKPGAEEPFYRAAKDGRPATIFSRNDYFSSALHEIAHWCIAGKKRRQLDDFGYWYAPEGRTAEQQVDFEAVEVKPQAIEWALSLAANHQFHYSADNLSQGIDASMTFKAAVHQQLVNYLEGQSLPPRAKLLFDRMLSVFNQDNAVELPHV
ncbi:elongation factor P hydroxylase [Aliikangiella marina]|uniref:Elongation factor P hydroxylase n=1 Tax=Aliikangiella marina TaxID=1712262 RepID=A0A545TH70_9GAMM|nr:elongation factor P hydroxylase [Aliikangiella marina]TQV76572.1 elongation factor P hydroxylase [Aliikangiella marina]